MPAAEQAKAILEIADRKALAIVGKAIRKEQQDGKKRAREAKERGLAARQRLLPDKRYGVIYADPEWRFEPYSRESGMDRAADNHYPTSETSDIVLRPVGDIADKDCVLFLWATAPMLPAALRVMAGWGFAYKSQLIWNKDRTGTGYWFRNKHELLLVGTRGDVPAPAMGDQWPSVVDAPVAAIDEMQALGVDAVGKQRRLGAHGQPGGAAGAAFEIVQHDHFVVAGQADALEARRRRGHEMVEHLRRGGAAIDIVAQHDDELAAGYLFRVTDDGVLQREQFVEAAMHVADED